jgi:cellulose synthase operon protein C
MSALDQRLLPRMAQVTGLVVLVVLLAACGQTSFTESERLERATTFQERGNLRAAVIELKNLLQENPGHVEGRWRLGVLHLELGEGSAAVADLERAISQGWQGEDVPVQLARARLLQREYQAVVNELQARQLVGDDLVAEAYVLRGQAYLGLEQVDRARQEFRAALLVDGAYAPALTGLARVSLQRENADIEAAHRYLVQALDLDRDYPDAWDLLGDIQRSRGELREAEASFTRLLELSRNPYLGHYKRAMTRIALQDLEGAARDHERMSRLAPDLHGTAYIEGVLRFYNQEYQAAAESLERSLSGNANHLPAMFFAGASHYALGNWQQAETYLGRYLRAHPDTPAANHLLAAVRLRGGQVDDAHRLLQRVLAANPGDAAALDLMASIHAARGDNVASLDVLRQRVSMEPESVQARMRLAAALMAGGDRDAGFAEMEAARELDPEDAGIDVTVVARLLQQGQFDRALEEALALAEKRPGVSLVHNLVGVSLLGLNRVDEAAEAFDRALEVEPGNFTATRNRALMLFRQGSVDEARSLMERSLEQRPDDLRLLVLLGNFEAQHGAREQGVRYLTRAMEAHPRALEPRILLARHHFERDEPRRALALLEAVREHHPDNPQLLEQIAHAQMASGQLESGINTLRRLAEIAPGVAEVQFRLGVAQRQAGRPGDARRAFARAVEIDAGHARAHMALAAVDFEAGRYDDALAAARRVQELEGHRAAGFILEGDIHREREAYPQALEAFENAYRQSPSTGAAVKRFDIARRMGDVDSAQGQLAQRVAEYPDDHQSRLILASSYIETGRYAEAIPHYEVLIEHAPDNALLLNNLAFLYQRQGDARAVEVARRANRLSPDDPRIKDTLGVALLDHGDRAEGLALIKAAREALPDVPAIAYHHALALARNNRPAEAIEVLRELLAKNAEFAEREDAEALLASLE